jgi:hypothetical protein
MADIDPRFCTQALVKTAVAAVWAQFEFDWNLNGQVAWLFPPENTINIGARTTKQV